MKDDGDNIPRLKISLWNQPEGRLRKFNNLRLIETGDYMYIPITQVNWLIMVFKKIFRS